MKYSFFVLAASFSLVFVSCVTIGNGDIITDERLLSSFEEIEIAGSAEVRFHSNTENRVLITVDSNLNEYFETSVSNNVLKIRQKPGRKYLFTKKIVDVYCPNITGVLIAGSGSFEAVDKIKAQTFKINIAGSGRINGIIECGNLFANISGSGEINITGNSTGANISISGSGNFIGTEFNIKNCSVNISGSGKVNVFVENNLDANITGSGNIKYKGNPKINFKNAGSGRIINIE